MSEPLDFRISAGLKNIIGKELITNDFIAIFELVKNAYDADAKKVQVIFQNIKESDTGKKPKILVVDDGHGMTLSALKSKWLFVGYSEKKPGQVQDFRDKIANRKRVFAGAKGIGRFSADRLGENLALYTKTKTENIVHQLSMNWKKFEKDQNEEFESVKVDYEELKAIPQDVIALKNFNHGTILEISKLNDKWDESKLLRLKRYLQRLINPSQTPEQLDFRIDLIADEFSKSDKKKTDDYEKVNGLVKNVVFEKLNIKTTYINSRIENGKIKTRLIDKGKFVFELEEENNYGLLDDISVHVFFMNEIAKSTFTRLMGIISKDYGSIFLYKNGFRVHPYGDEDNDWLELDKRKAQGYARYLSTRELIGRIEVYGVQPGFMEVSSRDSGVLKTSSFDQLRKFFREKVLRRLERYVVEGINWDTDDEVKKKSEIEIKTDSLNLIARLAGQIKDPEKNVTFNKDFLEILKERQIENIPEVIRNIEQLKQFLPKTQEKRLDKEIKNFRSATKTLRKEKRVVEKQLEVKKKENLFLDKAVSIDKKFLINLYHSVKLSSHIIDGVIDDVNEKIEKGSPVEEIKVLIDAIGIENQKIRVIADVVSIANFNMKVKKIEDDLVGYVTQYVTKMLEKRSIKLECNFLNNRFVFIRSFTPLEMSAIFDNFMTNSSKAGAKHMTIKFKRKGDALHILIGDDGSGIRKSDEDYVFNRGFTTTTGSGLGLHHVKTMVESMDGKIRFVGNHFEDMGKGACFEVIF